MSTTGRSTESPAADDLAASIDSAAFVRIVAAPTGDAVAAAGLLGRACRERAIGLQVSVAPRDDRATEADLTLAVGCRRADRAIGLDGPASPVAARVARALDSTPDAALAAVGPRLAGEGGDDPSPGIAGPTGDPVDDLAHSTLLRGPWSGDPGAVETRCADLAIDPATADADAICRLAGAAAIEAVDDRPPAAGAAVTAAIGTTDAGPFASIGGLADVLDVLAQERPGGATTLALGGRVPDAIEEWREHATRAHRALDDATTGRYDGLSVRRLDASAPVGTVARLAVRYETREPLVLVIADDRVAIASRSAEIDAGRCLGRASDSTDVIGNGTRAIGLTDADADAADLIASVREVAA
ncbi:hypothetical protein [Halococcoides cellulosivorans]|uniref:Exonuclease RecJ n=1 Tax=Halococcoides cellulosivorans TaxID=1679096 RepID=A0A2R4X1Z4_9EURY|nr:hypothetical protein [Halococcoides cellulosivorans]AWB27798.1 hypothetical protein HARCEL1_08780 [Halococcoides cellulosivorans]